ncbi:hypothetical protein [Mameliella alba]|uniref:N-acetyltransferase domain-containing protein n=1 Tax=Mameliella alba TaxID=561184 RepID=A0A0B3SI75_9RHOB|nr:hypothetical protein [Mameliella alba]KHQ50289.1 hypothetical protein OA50_05137 [Mameliella alba]
MIDVTPWDNRAGLIVLSQLDPADWREAQLARGGGMDHLDVFADWRLVQANALLSVILRDTSRGGEPFAVLCLAPTGHRGIAQAALLARSHKRFRRCLVAAAGRIRDDMPEFCREWGIRRVEARCWAGHPRAPRFLAACGFLPEVRMAGFGGDDPAEFVQFAWVEKEAEHVHHTQGS